MDIAQALISPGLPAGSARTMSGFEAVAETAVPDRPFVLRTGPPAVDSCMAGRRMRRSGDELPIGSESAHIPWFAVVIVAYDADP